MKRIIKVLHLKFVTRFLSESVKYFWTRFRSNPFFRFFFLSYLFIGVCLFLYSFTQMDLNLTLLRHQFILAFQKPFIYLGYYQRPLSALIFLVLVVLLYLLFFSILWAIHKKKLTGKELGILIGLLVALLWCSYPAFSHDIFNYIFDARIFTNYHLNPYQHKALDFPNDPWIRFMHWTHRTYPYGPSWLLITIPLSFIGSQIFLVTLLLFKLLAAVSYIGCVYYIRKILEKISPAHVLAGTVFFALNPLVLIESLVSAHNDVPMLFLALFSLYLLLSRKRVLAIVVFLLSMGVKYATGFLLPFFAVGFYSIPAVFLSVITFVYASHVQIGLQPWYFLWVLPFAALSYKNVFIRITTAGLSMGLLLRYLPFISDGSWYPSAVPYQHTVTALSIIISVALFLGIFLRKKFSFQRQRVRVKLLKNFAKKKQR